MLLHVVCVYRNQAGLFNLQRRRVGVPDDAPVPVADEQDQVEPDQVEPDQVEPDQPDVSLQICGYSF